MAYLRESSTVSIQVTIILSTDYQNCAPLLGPGIRKSTTKRHISVKLFSVVLFSTNFVFTFMLLFITVAAMHPSREFILPKEVLLIPLTILVTLPNLRAAMPDVPPFGENINEPALTAC